MLDLVARGVGLGFAAGANPGPFQNYLISTTLVQGWRKSIIVVLAPIPTDIPMDLNSGVFLEAWSSIRVDQFHGYGDFLIEGWILRVARI